MIFDFLASTAAASSETLETKAPVSVPTINDAVTSLIENPSETVSNIGNFFKGLLSKIVGSIPSLILAVLFIVVGLLLSKVVVNFMSRALDKTKLELTVKKFVKQVTRIVLYVFVATLVMSALGIPSTSIFALVGTAGVAIGLALQDSLANVAGGFILMVTKPFVIGDYINVNGVEGTVSQISIYHTRLNSATNQAIFIPNGQAVNATVTNNTSNIMRRIDLTFSISYNDDFEKAQSIIMEILQNHDKVLKDPPPQVRMLQHGNSAIVIAVRPWSTPADYWDVYFDVTEAVRREFIKNGVAIPFDQLDVHVVNDHEVSNKPDLSKF